MKNSSDLNIVRRSSIRVFSALIVTAILLSAFDQGEKSISEQKKAKKDDKIKIFMLWDMEGTSGLFTKPQAWYWDPGVPEAVKQEGLELITADVNSAAKAALDAGVDELIICDTHHGGNNIIPSKLISDPRITFLPRSTGMENGKMRWMPGLDAETDGFMVMAHHAKAGTEGAFLPHAQSLSWADITINGLSVGEIGIESCFAGHWSIPTVMMSGDRAGCREAEQQYPGIVTAEVKHAVTWEQAEGLDPEAARKLVAKKVREAVKKIKSGHSFTTYKPSLPMTVVLRLTTPQEADRLVKRPGVERVDQNTVRVQVAEQSDIMKALTGASLDMELPKK